MIRVSKRLSRISVDSELWKAAYYNQFVLPRASRIPGIKETGRTDRLRYSSKLSRWLDDAYLVKTGSETNWKQQYRLRHNWSNGQCAISEIIVTERPPEPPLLVMMHNGVVFTADSITGLRAWDSKQGKDMIASTSFVDSDTGTPQLPTSMALDFHDGDTGQQKVVVGYESGAFTIFELKNNSFTMLFSHPASSNGMLSALAYSSPYLLTMTEDHILSLYNFPQDQPSPNYLAPPQLMCSLRSHTAWPPISLSLRPSTGGITAAIAYALPTLLSGWTVGIQELRLTRDGELLESRLASAGDDCRCTSSNYPSTSLRSIRSSSQVLGTNPLPKGTTSPSQSKPTSMSYSHPYLLVTHPDNTLTLYLVKSTSTALSISSGSRLWGHSSAVSGVHVGMRGKAVSVSRFGGELRVWDLEGGTTSSMARKRTLNGELSVKVQPNPYESPQKPSYQQSTQGVSLRFALDQSFDDSTMSRGWVGFDEQNVIVLREKSLGSQALVIYDFT
ncbi:F-box domain-containing protein [Dendryphion nanum]|uniref:F-box domain-containing protein n=1 Tax=Dendryphion nanum TaxID=256645 RepID=A0A9P9IFE1_9PLEO|nr:F-box domain-containing protein [Dendryphion nanum]